MSTILQISDLHLLSHVDGRLKGVPTADSVRQVLVRARDEVPAPSRLVLSGDLSHEHTVAGYELLADLLGDWRERSLLVPGNHDDRAAMRSVFDQVPPGADEDVWFRVDLGGWQLIGLDSHVPGQVHGELSETTLARLDGWLAAEPDRPALVFLHHPPVRVHSPWLDKIMLRNPAALARVIQRYKTVQAVCCGHVHQVIEDRFAGVPLHTAPSAAIQFKPRSEQLEFDLLPPGLRVIELHRSHLTTRVVRLDEIPYLPSDD